MRQHNFIMGFWDRVDAICAKTELSRAEIARKMNRARTTLYRRDGGMDALTLGRFCAVTKTDANWLLGIGKENRSMRQVTDSGKDSFEEWLEERIEAVERLYSALPDPYGVSGMCKRTQLEELKNVLREYRKEGT